MDAPVLSSAHRRDESEALVNLSHLHSPLTQKVNLVALRGAHISQQSEANVLVGVDPEILPSHSDDIAALGELWRNGENLGNGISKEALHDGLVASDCDADWKTPSDASSNGAGCFDVSLRDCCQRARNVLPVIPIDSNAVQTRISSGAKAIACQVNQTA